MENESENFGTDDEAEDLAFIELNENELLAEEPLSDSDSMSESDEEDLMLGKDEEEEESLSSASDSSESED